jgi:hypothetical protein
MVQGRIPDEGEFDIFLSYQSPDVKWVRQLKSALKAKGFKVWLAEEQIRLGERFAEALERGVIASRNIVFVISKTSFRSEWVKDEYYFALGLANDRAQAVRIVPVLLDGTPARGFLSSRQHVDFSETKSFDVCVDRLCAALREVPDVAPVSEPARPVNVAGPITPERRSLDLGEYLRRRFATTAREIQDASRMRWAVALLTAIVAVVLSICVAKDVLEWWWLTATFVPALVGYGVTAPLIARSRAAHERCRRLSELVALCGESTEDGCVKVRMEVWRIALASAGVGEA